MDGRNRRKIHQRVAASGSNRISDGKAIDGRSGTTERDQVGLSTDLPQENVLCLATLCPLWHTLTRKSMTFVLTSQCMTYARKADVAL
ncbi:hypothetical protein EVAR_57200_1 [Eumeta japonica]|uniref:Uncharacterized protein n=1 Tax=Eumeta variegata TaxID=151549 RepID=A0A4C1Z1K9_EUMVA|nr:hypothetical protein EVAR_57200_1 [Eumeta japonica]